MKINNDLISVVIPIYNCKKYIHRCIDSIINQTYKNLEIIIVDDGSSDGSQYICDKYENIDNRIRVFHIENSGVSEARNIGYKYSTGKYIAFVDSDDWIEPDMYEKLYYYIVKNKVDVICCDYYINYENNSKEIINEHNKINKILSKDESFYYLIKNEFYGGYIWNRLYSKEILNKIEIDGKIFENNIQVCEDLLMNCRIISEINEIYYIQEPYYHYYQNLSSVTKDRKYNEKIITIKDAYEKIIEIYEKNSIKNMEFVIYEYIKILLNLNYRIKLSCKHNLLEFNRMKYIRKVLNFRNIKFNKKIYLLISLAFPYLTSHLKEKLYEIKIRIK